MFYFDTTMHGPISFCKTWFVFCTDLYNPDLCLLYLSWRWTIHVTVEWRFISPELVLQTKRPCQLRNKGLNRAHLLRIDRHRHTWPVMLDLKTPEDTVNTFLEALDAVIQTRVFSTSMPTPSKIISRQLCIDGYWDCNVKLMTTMSQHKSL